MDKQCKKEIAHLLELAGVGKRNIRIVIESINQSLYEDVKREMRRRGEIDKANADLAYTQYFEIGGINDIAHGT